MRGLIAVSGGVTVYLIVGLLTGTAPRITGRRTPKPVGRLQRWLTHVGVDVTPRQFIAGSTALGLASWMLLAFVMGQWWAALFPAVAVTTGLGWSYERRRRTRLREIANAWPDAIRHIMAYVRSGATVPYAVSALAAEGPAPIRAVFEGWDARARLAGFAPALEIIREQLADATSDRVIEVLLIAWEWGGDLVVDILSDLASEITEDLRTEAAIWAEGTTQRIEGWLMAVVPWALLVYLMAGESSPYRAFYRSGAGRLVIGLVAMWWAAGLVWLRYLRRSQPEERVLGNREAAA